MTGRDSHTDTDAALAAYRDAAQAEADALFDDRTLDAQRARILDRIAHLGHHARVIRFPAAPVAPPPPAAVNPPGVGGAGPARRRGGRGGRPRRPPSTAAGWRSRPRPASSWAS